MARGGSRPECMQRGGSALAYTNRFLVCMNRGDRVKQNLTKCMKQRKEGQVQNLGHMYAHQLVQCCNGSGNDVGGWVPGGFGFFFVVTILSLVPTALCARYPFVTPGI